jgi:hypothetical protein
MNFLYAMLTVLTLTIVVTIFYFRKKIFVNRKRIYKRKHYTSRERIAQIKEVLKRFDPENKGLSNVEIFKKLVELGYLIDDETSYRKLLDVNCLLSAYVNSKEKKRHPIILRISRGRYVLENEPQKKQEVVLNTSDNSEKKENEDVKKLLGPNDNEIMAMAVEDSIKYILEFHSGKTGRMTVEQIAQKRIELGFTHKDRDLKSEKGLVSTYLCVIMSKYSKIKNTLPRIDRVGKGIVRWVK